MGLDKKSQQSDQIANPYRAALYLARGQKKTGLSFLKKANFKQMTHPRNRQQELLLAEKALDRYHQLYSSF